MWPHTCTHTHAHETKYNKRVNVSQLNSGLIFFLHSPWRTPGPLWILGQGGQAALQVSMKTALTSLWELSRDGMTALSLHPFHSTEDRTWHRCTWDTSLIYNDYTETTILVLPMDRTCCLEHEPKPCTMGLFLCTGLCQYMIYKALFFISLDVFCSPSQVSLALCM